MGRLAAEAVERRRPSEVRASRDTSRHTDDIVSDSWSIGRTSPEAAGTAGKRPATPKARSASFAAKSWNGGGEAGAPRSGLTALEI